MPELEVINIGLNTFLDGLQKSNVPFAHLAWKPPAHGDVELIDILFDLTVGFRDADGCSLLDRANQVAVERVRQSRPVLRRIRPAGECIPALTKNTLLHAGPPVSWDNMCEPMRGAIVGALKYEGLAESTAEALALMDAGEVEYGPTHAHNVVAPMAGVVTSSMPLFVVEDGINGHRSFSPINEGLGQVLRFGANSADVVRHLNWLEKVLAPALDKALLSLEGINLRSIMAQAIGMGDELHQRNVAASLLFFRAVCVELAEAAPDRRSELEMMEFLTRRNEQFFLNIAMAACRCTMEAVENIPYCSVITNMTRNGVDFGIQLSGLGSRWLTARSQKPQALYFPGYSEADANPDMGDSSIVECCGLGGFAMANAPAVARFGSSGSLIEALQYTRNMEQITVGVNPDLPIPNMNFSGVPVCIDVRQVVSTGILPIITSGVAHQKSEIGQVGAGHSSPPMTLMNNALKQFHAALTNRSNP